MSSFTPEFEELNNLIAEIYQEIESANKSLESIEGESLKVSEQCDLLEESNTSTQEAFESLVICATEQNNDLTEHFNDIMNERLDQITETGEMIDDQIEICKDDTETTLENKEDSFTKALASGWQASVINELSISDECFRKCFEKLLNDLCTSGDHVDAAVHFCIDDLCNHIEGRLTSIIEEQGQKTFDTIIDRLVSEVADAIVVSQLQVQTTAILSPYLPQLAAAKASASSIRSALEVMRAGF